MEYEPNLKQYTLKIKGDTDELKIWMRELCNTLPGAKIVYQEIKENVENLEREVNFIQVNYDASNRLYFNKNQILYTPNVNSKEGREFQYTIFMKYFEVAKEKAETVIKNLKK